MIVAEGEEKAGSHTEEDENYFVSMTDMMVGILFIFIIMLMIFAFNFRHQTDETKVLTATQEEQLRKANELAEQISELRRRIAGEISELNRADQARAELLQEIKKKLDVVGLKVAIDTNTGVLRLTDEAIRFASDSSTLDGTATRNVDAVAKVLEEVLPTYAGCAKLSPCDRSRGYLVETVFIEGHTDKTGEDNRNWSLSTERAVNTYRRMVENVPRLRALMNSGGREILSVSGYASTRPVDDRAGRQANSANRRIDLRFVMEVDRRERLSEVEKLLDQMEQKVKDLKAPTGRQKTALESKP